MADVEQTQKDDSTHHVWSFPLWVCLRVGSWCQCIRFGFWVPNWFYRTTNQEQLCGFWKHDSLSGFFPLWPSWSQLRCLQTHTTKLPDEKSWRLREENQHYPNHQSFHEISFAFDVFKVLPARMFVHKSPRSWFLWYVFPWRTATIRSHKSSAGIPSNLNPASKEMISDSVELCETEVLFLTHPNDWNKCMTTQNAQCSTWCRFWIPKISYKIGVLKKS